jgi:6-phosphogluconolactonase (cycloisomerase 2 family)
MGVSIGCRLAIVTIALALVGVAPEGAEAAIGDLTPLGCIEDNDPSPTGGPDACATQVDGLNRAHGLAMSPDGTSLYVSANSDDAVVRFSRNPATGALTAPGCIGDDTGAETCAQTNPALGGAAAIEVTPDGKSVYVIADDDDAVVRFDRDPATGALTPQGCVDDDDTNPLLCALEVPGLDNPRDIAVTNEAVYVASFGDDAIVALDRNPATGALTSSGCVDDDDDPGQGPDACAAETNGMRDAATVAISPDGEFVYVGSGNDDAIVRFDANPTTGALTAIDCIEDVNSGPDNCTVLATTDGFSSPGSMVMSPDGTDLYIGSFLDNSVMRFDRDTGSGALTPQECIGDDISAPSCGIGPVGLADPRSLALSPDGRNLYAGGLADDAIVQIPLNPATGAITGTSVGDVLCVDDNDPPDGPDPCPQSTDGLDHPTAIVVSPDGAFLYAVAEEDDSLTMFARETDTDGDGVINTADNCPFTSNPSQTDTDGDAQGDACDADDDDDTVGDGSDNCPLNANASQTNTDGDAQGDACDADDDNDGALDGSDNCPTTSNPSQANTDGDAQGDACDTDDDNDTVGDGSDSCPTGATGPGDDLDGDGCKDSEDGDDDGDGVGDGTDNCPRIANAGQADADSDAVGDVCDPTPNGPSESNDKTAPDTTITSGPKRKTKSKSASFTFTATESGSTFECSLDGAAFLACDSPRTVRVKEGRHTLSVRATDAAGNTDASPAIRAWKVKRKRKR